MDIKRTLLRWFINFLVKTLLRLQINASAGAVKSKIMSNQELAKELQKPIIRKFETQKVHSAFIDKILGAHLVIMQLIRKSNKFVFCWMLLIYFSKYVLVVLLKQFF